MEYKAFGNTWMLRFDRGEEIVACLKKFCLDEEVKLASVAAIGAAEDVELGYYKVPTREYLTQVFAGEHEITGLLGNISTKDGEVYLHLHITIGNESFEARAGHLVAATVSGTCEMIVRSIKGEVDRFKDEKETGLNLLKL